MRGVYSVSRKITGITSDRTLAVLTAPTGKLVEIHKISLTNENNATAFQAACKLTDLTSFVAGTGFSSVTPQKKEPGDQSAGSTFSIGTSSSTEPTTYASEDRLAEAFNGQLGYLHEPIDPNDRIWIGSAAVVGIRIEGAPATSTDWRLDVEWREVG